MNRAQRRRDKRRSRAGIAAIDVGAALERGLEHHRSGRLAEARQVYERVLQQDSRNARALFLLGTLALQERNYEAAESFIRQAIAADSGEASYHNNLGVVLRESGRLEDALDSYREAIELRPDYAEAYCNFGIALKELGRTEEAISPLERAVELAPKFGGAYSNLGNFSKLVSMLRFETLFLHTNATCSDVIYEQHVLLSACNLGVVKCDFICTE